MFGWFFQYSVICHFSQYIWLALTDFHKNTLFYRKCMWLQLRQVLKKFTKGNARKLTVSFAFCAYVNVTKIEKNRCFSFELAQITWLPILNALDGLLNYQLMKHFHTNILGIRLHWNYRYEAPKIKITTCARRFQIPDIKIQIVDWLRQGYLIRIASKLWYMDSEG